jgi:hypothetical protein
MPIPLGVSLGLAGLGALTRILNKPNLRKNQSDYYDSTALDAGLNRLESLDALEEMKIRRRTSDMAGNSLDTQLQLGKLQGAGRFSNVVARANADRTFRQALDAATTTPSATLGAKTQLIGADYAAKQNAKIQATGADNQERLINYQKIDSLAGEGLKLGGGLLGMHYAAELDKEAMEFRSKLGQKAAPADATKVIPKTEITMPKFDGSKFQPTIYPEAGVPGGGNAFADMDETDPIGPMTPADRGLGYLQRKYGGTNPAMGPWEFMTNEQWEQMAPSFAPRVGNPSSRTREGVEPNPVRLTPNDVHMMLQKISPGPENAQGRPRDPWGDSPSTISQTFSPSSLDFTIDEWRALDEKTQREYFDREIGPIGSAESADGKYRKSFEPNSDGSNDWGRWGFNDKNLITEGRTDSLSLAIKGLFERFGIGNTLEARQLAVQDNDELGLEMAWQLFKRDGLRGWAPATRNKVLANLKTFKRRYANVMGGS